MTATFRTTSIFANDHSSTNKQRAPFKPLPLIHTTKLPLDLTRASAPPELVSGHLTRGEVKFGDGSMGQFHDLARNCFWCRVAPCLTFPLSSPHRPITYVRRALSAVRRRIFVPRRASRTKRRKTWHRTNANYSRQTRVGNSTGYTCWRNSSQQVYCRLSRYLTKAK